MDAVCLQQGCQGIGTLLLPEDGAINGISGVCQVIGEISGLGHIQATALEQLHMGEYLPGCAVQDDLAVIHHHNPVALAASSI